MAHGDVGLAGVRRKVGDVCRLPPWTAFIPRPWASGQHRRDCCLPCFASSGLSPKTWFSVVDFLVACLAFTYLHD